MKFGEYRKFHPAESLAGTIGTRHGLMASAADSQRVTLHGHQGHASQPHNTCDPAVMAASTVMRLQTLVSREVDPATAAVVTVGSLRAGDAENIIPETAELKINVRTVDAKVREHVLAGIKRIVEAESAASDAPKRPTFTPTSRFPFTVNDDKLTSALEHSFSTHFGEDKHSYTREVERLKGSEDFPILGTSIGKPCCYWVYGGTDPEHWDRCEREERLGKGVPINHSPFFAPVIMPTLKVGAEAYVVAALTWLAK